MRTRVPLPAASIITPMMLFAFTRRPLRDSHTSAANVPATSVSRAAARACNPSLFTISASIRAIADVGGQVDDSVLSPAHRLLDGGGEGLFAIREGANQHRQARASQALDASGSEQSRCDIRRRRAE